jgi:cytochrome c-type biogenesis protein
MLLLLGAIVAGALTTLAPCVLPMLPVIVGGSLGPSSQEARRRAYVIAASLGLSIVVFTLILKATTALIGIPSGVWQWLSGGILIALGVVSLFPGIWDRISAALRLQERSTRQQQGMTGAVLTGAALGPVFSSCSPMYGYVIVTVLPASLAQGMLLLLGYVVGLCVTLLAIALLGQRFIGNARWAADPHSWFRRGLGLVFVLVGLAIAFGIDKDIQTWVIQNSPIAPWELDSGFIPE